MHVFMFFDFIIFSFFLIYENKTKPKNNTLFHSVLSLSLQSPHSRFQLEIVPLSNGIYDHIYPTGFEVTSFDIASIIVSLFIYQNIFVGNII